MKKGIVRKGDRMDEVIISRQSVCMGDDLESHTISYPIRNDTTFSGVFLELIQRKYFPCIDGNDVVWMLHYNGEDLLSWKTKENKLYSRFVTNEPAVLSMRNGSESMPLHFIYFSSTDKRAKQIFDMFEGQKFHIWSEGFMPEYESYKIPRRIEAEWLKK